VSAIRLFAFTCGWISCSRGVFLAGERGKIRVPVPVYLIDHPDGLVLFDSGVHPDAIRDPRGRLGELVASVFTVELPAGDDVGGRLAALGVDPARIRYVVSSHLHFDHTGGNVQIPNARIVVQRREWAAGHGADAIAANVYNPADYDTGHDVLTVEGEHDLFGDGLVVTIPTYGHTPGHQSLRVRLATSDVVLTADACYLRRTLEAMHLPPVVHDADAMRVSIERLRALRAAGARLFFGHDPDFWTTVPQAPAAIT